LKKRREQEEGLFHKQIGYKLKEESNKICDVALHGAET
jgi:hypothetical protein